MIKNFAKKAGSVVKTGVTGLGGSSKSRCRKCRW